MTWDTLGAAVEVITRDALHEFAVIPKRWIAGLSLARLEKCRHLWENGGAARDRFGAAPVTQCVKER